MSERVTSLHFTLNGFQSALPGVEAVMLGQARLLRNTGAEVTLLAGATDHPNPEEEGIVVYPGIRSGAVGTWLSPKDSHFDAPTLERVARDLRGLADRSAVISHNGTNSARHNPVLGMAMARLSEDLTVIHWVHDSRGASPEHLRRFLPDHNRFPLVTVSHTKAVQLQDTIGTMHAAGLSVPNYDVTTIYNPINPLFLGSEEVAKPESLEDLAPNIDQISGEQGLPQDKKLVEEILLDPDSEYLRMVVPARVVVQKGISRALAVAHTYAEVYGQKTALIVTGPPDFRKPENKKYWDFIRSTAPNSRDGAFEPIFLGGIKERYMPWMYRNSHLLVAFFENEGFGLPPIEAACMGLPSVVSDDEALLETTGGNTLSIPLFEANDGSKVVSAAARIHQYLSSNQPNQDVRALAEKARRDYSPEVILRQTIDVLGLTRA